MRVELHSTVGEVSDELRLAVERCVRLSLGRLRPRLPRVVATVSEAMPGHTLGGIIWQVVLRVDGPRRLVVIEVDRDVLAAIGRAADRARRCLERDLTRREWDRWRLPAPPRRSRGSTAAPGEPPPDVATGPVP